MLIGRKLFTGNAYQTKDSQSQGEVLEWLKRHAWKACKRQKRFGGSNPPLSAVSGVDHSLISELLLSGKSFSDDKNKAETLLQDFSLFCYFACWKKHL